MGHVYSEGDVYRGDTLNDAIIGLKCDLTEQYNVEDIEFDSRWRENRSDYESYEKAKRVLDTTCQKYKCAGVSYIDPDNKKRYWILKWSIDEDPLDPRE